MSQSKPQQNGRDVVITAIGVVSPYGVGCDVFWHGLSHGDCVLGPIDLFETDGFASNIGGQIRDTDVASADAGNGSRANTILIAAAAEALEEAALSTDALASAAVSVGGTGGGMLEVESWHSRYMGSTAELRQRGTLRRMVPAAQTQALAQQFQINGPQETPILACSSSAAAIVSIADMIATGLVDVGIAAGVDTLTRVCFMGFNTLKLVDKQPCRPFARDRRGMSVSEGSAVLVLESREHALRRGATIRAAFAGGSITSDAFHPIAPPGDGEGAVRAMRDALDRANLTPGDIAYVNAHGTGTVQNDKAEARALETVFGPGGVLVSGSKSLIGHTMGAAGAIEAVATILALEAGVLPPTANLHETDPEIPFDCIPRTPRLCSLHAAMSNSFGFGGQNVSLVFTVAG